MCEIAAANDRQAGFTLLEIIVALVVFGFLFVGLSQGTRTGFALWDAQARRIGQTEELDATVRTVRSLLTGIPILPVTAADNSPRAIAITGEANRLLFVSDLPTGLGATRRADITLEERTGRLILAWTPHRHEAAGAPPVVPTETELIRGVGQLEIAYYGAPAGELPLWRTQWPGPQFPLLIRIRLRFPKGDARRWPDLIAAPQLSAP
jgi:general secretion pathway protein J